LVQGFCSRCLRRASSTSSTRRSCGNARFLEVGLHGVEALVDVRARSPIRELLISIPTSTVKRRHRHGDHEHGTWLRPSTRHSISHRPRPGFAPQQFQAQPELARAFRCAVDPAERIVAEVLVGVAETRRIGQTERFRQNRGPVGSLCKRCGPSAPNTTLGVSAIALDRACH